MKKKAYLIIVVLIFGCSSPEIGNSKSNKVQKIEVGRFEKLISKYKDIKFDTLKVFSSVDIENSKYKYNGMKLDSTEIGLLPQSTSEVYPYDNGYFACYKFPIDKNKMALITRTPSIYESSSIKLFVFDKRKDTISEGIELAEIFGDAGDASEKNSWIFKDGKKYKAFTLIEASYDHSVDSEKDTTIETWTYYYLFDLSKSKIDTLSKDEKELAERFRRVH